jgi:hypothetical protein
MNGDFNRIGEIFDQTTIENIVPIGSVASLVEIWWIHIACD